MKIEQLTQIFKGWANLALDKFNLLDPEFKKEAERRLLICDKCPMREGNKCDSTKEGIAVTDFTYIATQERRIKGEKYKGCSCQLHAKVVCDNCQCPLGHWLEYKDKKQ